MATNIHDGTVIEYLYNYLTSHTMSSTYNFTTHIFTTYFRCYFDPVAQIAIVTKFGNRVICHRAWDTVVESYSGSLTSDKWLIVVVLQERWVPNILLVYDEILLLRYPIHWSRDAVFPNWFEN